jgi:uncharacterized membrane protein
MKRALAVFFTLALLSVSLFAATAVASPSTQGASGNGYGTCNGPLNYTHTYNSGNHEGGYYYCNY